MLSLSEAEKEVLWDLSRGYDLHETAARRCLSYTTLTRRLSRTAHREGLNGTMRLVLAFVDEYLGILDPWPPIAEPIVLVMAKRA